MKKIPAFVDGILLGLLVIGVGALAALSYRVLYLAERRAEVDRDYASLAETFLLLDRLERGDVNGSLGVLRLRLASQVLHLDQARPCFDEIQAARVASLFAEVASYVEQKPLRLDNPKLEADVRRALRASGGVPMRGADPSGPER